MIRKALYYLFKQFGSAILNGTSIMNISFPIIAFY